jgi:hypothetical protein
MPSPSRPDHGADPEAQRSGEEQRPPQNVLEAIKYLFDRLEGRPSQSMRIFKDNLVRVEFRSYEEIRDGLLDQGIDIERLPDMRELSDDVDDVTEG